MENVSDVRRRLVALSQKTLALLSNVLHGVSAEEAHTWRDGADGWTITEIVCHLRDFNEIFLHRAEMIRDQERPTLPVYDHVAMVVAGRYNEQELGTVLAELDASRQRLVAFFTALTPEQWERTGVHPERGTFTLTDAALQATSHDSDHTEQITRIIATHRV